MMHNPFEKRVFRNILSFPGIRLSHFGSTGSEQRRQPEEPPCIFRISVDFASFVLFRLEQHWQWQQVPAPP